jgi:hypothetical protein
MHEKAILFQECSHFPESFFPNFLTYSIEESAMACRKKHAFERQLVLNCHAERQPLKLLLFDMLLDDFPNVLHLETILLSQPAQLFVQRQIGGQFQCLKNFRRRDSRFHFDIPQGHGPIDLRCMLTLGLHFVGRFAGLFADIFDWSEKGSGGRAGKNQKKYDGENDAKGFFF